MTKFNLKKLCFDKFWPYKNPNFTLKPNIWPWNPNFDHFTSILTLQNPNFDLKTKNLTLKQKKLTNFDIIRPEFRQFFYFEPKIDIKTQNIDLLIQILT